MYEELLVIMYNDITPEEEETMRYHFATTSELDFKEWEFKRNLEPFEIREKIRNSKPFKDFIFQWNHGVYNNKKDVGELMGSLKTLAGTKTVFTLEDWYEYYFKNVKTYHQIIPLIEKMCKETKTPFQTGLNYWSIHILDSAYVGFQGEVLAKQAVEEWANNNDKKVVVRYATAEEDRVGGVDLIVMNLAETQTLLGIQVKRSGYFVSTRQTVIAAREGYNPQKYRKFKQQTGADVWYLNIEAYEKTKQLNNQTWWRALKDD